VLAVGQVEASDELLDVHEAVEKPEVDVEKVATG